MATFLTTDGINRHIDKIVEEAKKELILISPYLDVSGAIRKNLEQKTRATTIHIIYGKKRNLKPDMEEFLDGRVETIFRKNLHAKCYVNEKEALLTSMNLYQYSQENNDEMGILVSKKQDGKLYEDIYRQAVAWRDSEAARDSRVNSAAPKTRKKPIPPAVPATGFCIRCKTQLPLNVEQPYCAVHYRSWNRFKDDDYEDAYCHSCGKDWPASMRKPLCDTCYRQGVNAS